MRLFRVVLRTAEAICPPEGLACKEQEYPAFGVVPVVYRRLGEGRTQVLVATELKSDGYTKSPGQLTLAGCETGRIMPNGHGDYEEGFDSNLLGGLGEEVFGRVQDEESVEIVVHPMFNYHFAEGVMAKFAAVEVVTHQSQLGPMDGETAQTEWVDVEELDRLSNWRKGVAGIVAFIPHYLEFLENRNGNGAASYTINSEFFLRLFKARQKYPDSKVRLNGNRHK